MFAPLNGEWGAKLYGKILVYAEKMLFLDIICNPL
jgi:hypothetical protein